MRFPRGFGECKQKDTRTENTEHKQRKRYLNGIFVLLKVIEMIVLNIYSNLNTSDIFFKDSSNCLIQSERFIENKDLPKRTKN